MATFDIAGFTAEPSLALLDVCRKRDLHELATYYRISVSTGLRKAELKAALVSGLLEERVVVMQEPPSTPGPAGPSAAPHIPGQVVEPSVSTPMDQGLPEGGLVTLPRFDPLSIQSSEGSKQDARLKIRLARLQLEKEQREREFQLKREIELRRLDAELARAREVELMKVEAETKVKLRQLELQQASSPPVVASLSQTDVQFDVGQNSRLVPAFRDTEVEIYFESFERIATALRWPRDAWAILLQCKLVGKAQEVCSSLSAECSLDYDKLKSAILLAYELVPEAYRQRFWGLKKVQGQSFLDFAREKSVLFDRWCMACKAADLASVRELILIEEFKNCVTERMAVYLNEQKVSTLQQTATLADEFALVHKTSVVKHERRDTLEKASGASGEQDTRREVPVPRPRSDRKCFYCFKSGHLIADCEAYRRRQPVSTPRKPKGIGLIKNASPGSRPLSTETPDECFKPFIFKGAVSLSGKPGDGRTVTILRDTGGSQSLILASALAFDEKTASGTDVIVRGVGMTYVPAPLHQIWVQSDLVSGIFPVAVCPCFPIDGVDFIMGNDIAGGKVYPTPEVTKTPDPSPLPDVLNRQHPDVFPVGVLTRSQAHRQGEVVDLSGSVVGSMLEMDVMPSEEGEVGPDAKELAQEVAEPAPEPAAPPLLTREALIIAQKADPSLTKCFAAVDESDHLTGDRKQTFVVCDGLLMRRWTSKPGEDWSVVQQIVVPASLRQHVLQLAHDHSWSGHLGITKTYDRILQHFFWPAMKADVAKYCNTCHTCQLVGKPNQTVPPAPLCPIPAVGEPFEHVLVDCVGPLPRTRAGNQFLLTIMCLSTRFPEAIPLRRVTTANITKAPIKFFTTFGLPKTVQTDQGTNFLSRAFKQTLASLGVSHSVSSAYHPESQGALERWHQTLKAMLKKYCHDTGRSWDEGVPFVLFAIRNVKQESLGFSPATLVFGREVRGPLKMLKERFLSGGVPKTNVADFVKTCKDRWQRATSLAKEALCTAQACMKTWHDRKAVKRHFQAGDKVLVLLPVPGSALTARFAGPYVIVRKVSETNYVLSTPERRRKTRLCHINMLKPYHDRETHETVASAATSSSVSATVLSVEASADDDLHILSEGQQCGRLANSAYLAEVTAHLSHLSPSQCEDVLNLLHSYPSLFGDVPSRTNVCEHDINVGDATPIKQHAYRCPMGKREVMRKEVSYLVENGLAKPSHSPWSSPCLLTPKSDGTPRFCTDYRKVNAVTVADSFPLPRMEDCIDNIGPATFISKLDLLKGYWQVPLTPRASDISAFVTPDHFMQYTVMAFGMKNAPATFQRLMQLVLGDVPQCNVYLDDVVIHTATWEEHVAILRSVFQRLADASLTLNLAKCEFAKATVMYLGKQVGFGRVRPVEAKVEAILSSPATRRELKRFLGMTGYYRCFCKNFAVVVAPLTRLCSPKVPFEWSGECQHAFESAKSLLCSAPVLAAPNFSQPFKLEVDASATGAGAVLLQDDAEGVCHPVCYYSVKFKRHQLHYSTIEKEALAMLMALQHFTVYVGSSSFPVTVYTDHNPLTFLQRMYNHNQRLMRWALLVQDYDLVIQHKKGTENLVADALSRSA